MTLLLIKRLKIYNNISKIQTDSFGMWSDWGTVCTEVLSKSLFIENVNGLV